MSKEYIFIVNDPDGNIFAFVDAMTAQEYVKKCLINEHNLVLLKNYLMYVEETVSNNCETRPRSLSEFIDDELMNMNEYDYSIESLPILTKKDF